ncbi:MAG TPA: hypothetical protein VK601_16905 [Kofleriaceae bacterium]|nr:hypothetical protein [Kofleriaceae bacterium]
MSADLTTLILLEAGHTDALDAFVSSCLFDGCVWTSPRESDGIPNIERVLERTSDRLRLCGRIYNIDQTLHPFWLELSRDVSGPSATWILYFDVVESSARRACNALTSCDKAADIEWRVVLAGAASIHEEALVVVTGSTRALVRDRPQPGAPTKSRGRGRD